MSAAGKIGDKGYGGPAAARGRGKRGSSSEASRRDGESRRGGCWSPAAALVAAAAALTAPAAASAQSEAAPAAATPPARDEDAGLWRRETLTGDWGGLRSSLKDKGLQLGIVYIGEALGNRRAASAMG